MKEDSKKAVVKKAVAKSNVVEIDIPRSVTGEKFTYEVPEDEMENTAHIYQEQIRFDTQSPTRLSKGHVQKYDRRGWDNFRQYGTSQGWTIVPLYVPSGWDANLKELNQVGKKSPQR